MREWGFAFVFCLLGTLGVVAQEPTDSIPADSILLPADSIAPSDTLAAQQEKPRRLSLLRRIIRGFDRLDTAYIEPQHYLFTVMLQGTHTLDLYTLRSSGPDRQSMTFSPDRKMRFGPYFGWRWIFAGYTFEIGGSGTNSLKQELDLSIYSSQIGVDLFYRRTGSDYRLVDASLGRGVDASALDRVPFDGLQAGITGFNLYYIFNHGKFSYPAAFAQSTQQKISCGSWLAGIGYTRNSIELDHQALQALIDERLGEQTVRLDSGLMFNRVKYYDFSLSGGYGYNWVFAPRWLFAASVQMAVAHKRSVGDVAGDERNGFSFRNINLDAIGRFGLVYSTGQWFAGGNVILHTYNYHKSRFSTNNTFGSMNVYVGYNFKLKRKYRK